MAVSRPPQSLTAAAFYKIVDKAQRSMVPLFAAWKASLVGLLWP